MLSGGKLGRFLVVFVFFVSLGEFGMDFRGKSGTLRTYLGKLKIFKSISREIRKINGISQIS